jgi:Recombination endonuclease VII
MPYKDKNLDKACRKRNQHKHDARQIAWYKTKREKLQEQLAGRPRPQVCEICGTVGKKGVVWDHDHSTGLFRGWLCQFCNLALGNVRDRPNVLRALADYLEKGISP